MVYFEFFAQKMPQKRYILSTRPISTSKFDFLGFKIVSYQGKVNTAPKNISFLIFWPLNQGIWLFLVDK